MHDRNRRRRSVVSSVSADYTASPYGGFLAFFFGDGGGTHECTVFAAGATRGAGLLSSSASSFALAVGVLASAPYR
jgi:hypothetical protein